MNTMSWNRVWVRHGWALEAVTDELLGEGVHFYYGNETPENMRFLYTCLENINVEYGTWRAENVLTISEASIDENVWLAAVGTRGRGGTESAGEYTEMRPLNIYELDTYVSGVIRQLNRLSFETVLSCDGHDERRPVVWIQSGKAEQLIKLLEGLGVPCRLRKGGLSDAVYLLVKREELLDLAEQLSHVDEASLELCEMMEERIFQEELDRLLQIAGASGNEERIRTYIWNRFTPLVDEMHIDSYGNLIAKKAYGSGRGPVILLNAHMDLYEELIPGRRILKTDGCWRSSEGILGADDRAGIAVLLHMMKYLRTIRFNGTVKFILTVEEEVGLVGASHVDSTQLQDVDMAFVLDRRGTGDIVTSCGGYEAFCSETFGLALEQIAREHDAGEWACTAGGSSDTRIWARAGIQSVNLSVGYWNEHTANEWLDPRVSFQTVKLLRAVFSNMRVLLPVVRREQRRRRNLTVGRSI